MIGQYRIDWLWVELRLLLWITVVIDIISCFCGNMDFNFILIYKQALQLYLINFLTCHTSRKAICIKMKHNKSSLVLYFLRLN